MKKRFGSLTFVFLMCSLVVAWSPVLSAGEPLSAKRVEFFSRLFPEHRSGMRLDLLDKAGDFPVNRAGELVVTAGPYLGLPADLGDGYKNPLELWAMEADLAVVGVVQSRESHLTQDGEFIFSAYRFAVEETLHGAADIGSEILFLAPGGSIRLRGRHVVARDTVFKPFQVGSRYVLLLKSAAPAAYLADCAGSYELWRDSVRTTAWGSEFQDIVADRTPEEFLSEIRQLVAR